MTDDRRAQIVRLLETMNDGLPQPVRRINIDTGFVDQLPDNRESCPDCLANDRVMKGCETCGGSGYVKAPRTKDPYQVEKVQPYGIDPRRHERARERDAQIDRLSSQLAPPRKSEADVLADANRAPYGWEITRRRMYASYDYAALDRALEQLRDHDPGACAAINSCFVYGWTEPSAGYEARLQRGLLFLDEHLPDPLRAPGDMKHPAQAKWERKHAAA